MNLDLFKIEFFNFAVKFFEVISDGTWSIITTFGLDNLLDFYGSDRVNLRYGASAIAENILDVYNTILFIELFLLIWIVWVILWTFINFKDNSFQKKGAKNKYLAYYSLYKNKSFFVSKVVEFFWTLLPILVLFFIGYPSLVLLYLLEERIHPELIIKVIGHQWYWSYESDCGHINFINFVTGLDSREEFFDLIRAPIYHVGMYTRWYPFIFEYWVYRANGIEVTTLEELFYKWDTNCLIWGTLSGPMAFPYTDKASMMHFLSNSVENYNFIIDYSNVSNNNEYFATNVLENIFLKEALAEQFIDPFDLSNVYQYYLPYQWVDRLFDSFSYKYLWLDLDHFSDYTRYVRLENLMTFDRFECRSLTSDTFDSYLLKDYDLLYKGEKRLLEVDNRLILPTKTHIQFLVTSADVIHSFAIPSFGIKIDAIPGRLNQCFVFIKFEGTFFGQCSELCGVDHGYMPIVIEAVSYMYYYTSVQQYLGYYSDVYYASGWETLLSN